MLVDVHNNMEYRYFINGFSLHYLIFLQLHGLHFCNVPSTSDDIMKVKNNQLSQFFEISSFLFIYCKSIQCLLFSKMYYYCDHFYLNNMTYVIIF